MIYGLFNSNQRKTNPTAASTESKGRLFGLSKTNHSKSGGDYRDLDSVSQSSQTPGYYVRVGYNADVGSQDTVPLGPVYVRKDFGVDTRVRQ